VILVVLMAATPRNILGVPQFLIHLAMAASLATLVVRPRTELTPVLTWWPVARIGKVSYGIYLYHLTALFISAKLLEPPGLASAAVLTLVYTLVSIAMAEASYRTLEAYFRRFRHSRPRLPRWRAA